MQPAKPKLFTIQPFTDNFTNQWSGRYMNTNTCNIIESGKCERYGKIAYEMDLKNKQTNKN